METGYAAINIHVLREQTSENDLVVINNLFFMWLGRLMVIRQFMWLGNKLDNMRIQRQRLRTFILQQIV